MGKLRSLRFGEIVSDNAVLKILTSKPGKLPLEFDIEHVNLHSSGEGRRAGLLPGDAHQSQTSRTDLVDRNIRTLEW